MTINVLIVDPDIAFTVPIKRALEISGDYKVNVFASGKPALEVLERDPHDVAILDFGLPDIALPDLIEGMRRVQPWIFILVSPRTPEEIDQAPNLDIQGSITKPYFARQLGPVIREAALARARLANRERPPAPPKSALADSEAETPVGSPAFRPDDTFQQMIATLDPAGTLGMPEGATIRDMMGGLMADSPAPEAADAGMTEQHAPEAPNALDREVPPVSIPESLPEAPRNSARDAALMAEMALEVADDATVPLDRLPEALARRVETLPPADRPPLPPWIPADTPDQPTLVGDAYPDEYLHGPSFVSSLPAEPLPAPEPPPPAASAPVEVEETIPLHRPAKTPPEPEEDEGVEDDLSLTFAGLLPAEERPDDPVFGPEVAASALTPGGELSAQPAESEAAQRPPRAFQPQGADAVASLALQLTQLSVELAAQFTLLSRAGAIVAMAGTLPERDVQALLSEIGHIWEGESSAAAGQRPARFRYVQLPSGGDFLLYSARTVENMALTMLFPGDVPLKLIRKQAAQLLGLLERVPEPPADSRAEPEAEAEAARTLLSRPTELRPPEGLHEAAQGLGTAAPTIEETPQTAPIVGTEGSLASFSFVWLPRRDELPAEIVGLLPGWLEDIAVGHGWQLDGTQVQPAYVAAQVRLPADVSAAVGAEVFMRETAVHADDTMLWAEASYVVTPAREISDQEIAGLIEFRRESPGAVN